MSLDFQRMSSLSFKDEQMFVASFSEELLYAINKIPEEIASRLCAFADGTARLNSLQSLFVSCLCGVPVRKNQSFSSLMKWIRRPIIRCLWISSRSFVPIIFPGPAANLPVSYPCRVYDVRNMKRKLRDDEEHKQNSPWNIAADFDVEMSFSVEDIAGMLREYEADYHTGMKVSEQASLLYDYTSG